MPQGHSYSQPSLHINSTFELQNFNDVPNMIMKNILRSFASSSLNPLYKIKSFSIRNGNLGAFSYLYSTDTATVEPSSLSVSPPPWSGPKDTLFMRLMNATNPKDPTPKETIPQIIKKWVDEGKDVNSEDVRKTIKRFRNFGRHSHALQISEWIGSIENLYLTSGDAAVHLDLIYKVHGLNQAERYFESISDDSKDVQTYGTLLNCYVKSKLLDKAEAIMQKMREFGYAEAFPYNRMLNLYSQMGKQEKLKSLVQEMEDKGINFDKFSYNSLLSAYVSANDIMGMEKLLMKMEEDPLVVMEWNAYSIAANGYLKVVGDVTKAEIMLQKSEHLIKDAYNRGSKVRAKAFSEGAHGFEVLMTQYASMGRQDDVYRLWKLRRKCGRLFNHTYICIISSLLRLDDVDGAQRMYTWLVKKVNFNIGIPDMLVNAFCKKGHMVKAELIISSLMERGEKPNASTWSCMASGYCRNNQMEDAVKMTKRAITTSYYPGRRPDLPTLASCLKYLKEKGDTDGAEEIIGLLEMGGKFSAGFRENILRYLRKEGALSST